MSATSVRGHRSFQFSPGAVGKLFSVRDHIALSLPGAEYLRGEATAASARDITQGFNHPSDWIEYLTAHADDILRADFTWSRPEARIRLAWDGSADRLQLEVESQHLPWVEKTLGDLEQALGCPAIADQTANGGTAITKRYYAPLELDLPWLEKLVQISRGQLGRTINVMGRIRANEATSIDYGYRDLPQWWQMVTRQWTELSFVYLWIGDGTRGISFTFDLARRYLTLEMGALSNEEAQKFVSLVEKQFQLEEAPEFPYKHRRFARFFKIRKWKGNQAFADAIEQAVKKAYPVSPVLVDAYFTQGGSDQDLEPARTLPAFLNNMRTASDAFDEARIYFEGARGIGLSISINRNKSRLEVMTSLDRKRFDEVVDILEDRLDLKLLHEEARDESAADKTPLWQTIGKVALSVVTLFLTAEFIKETIPRYTLEITFPRASSEGLAMIETGSIHPHWRVERTRWWNTREIPTPSATIELFDRQGALSSRQTGTEAEVVVPSAPGDYQLAIQIPELGKSERIQLRRIRAADSAAP